MRRFPDVESQHRPAVGFCFVHDGIPRLFSRSDAGRRNIHITWPWRIGSGVRRFFVGRLGRSARVGNTPSGVQVAEVDGRPQASD